MKLAEALRNIEGADYKTWRNLSLRDRAVVLQGIENKFAEIPIVLLAK